MSLNARDVHDNGAKVCDVREKNRRCVCTYVVHEHLVCVRMCSVNHDVFETKLVTVPSCVFISYACADISLHVSLDML